MATGSKSLYSSCVFPVKNRHAELVRTGEVVNHFVIDCGPLAFVESISAERLANFELYHATHCFRETKESTNPWLLVEAKMAEDGEHEAHKTERKKSLQSSEASSNVPRSTSKVGLQHESDSYHSHDSGSSTGCDVAYQFVPTPAKEQGPAQATDTKRQATNTYIGVTFNKKKPFRAFCGQFPPKLS